MESQEVKRTEKYAKNQQLLAKNIQRRRTETYDEYMKRRKTVCSKCEYYSGVVKGSVGMCDYFCKEGKLRPCTGKDCVSMGVFKKKSN